MNTFKIQKILLGVIAAIGLAFLPLTVAAQDSSAGTAPPLAYGVPQILKLAQAKVTDDVILAYIHQSGNNYGLDADQIIYLKQQGISDKVLTAMLTRPSHASTPAPVATTTANPVPAQPEPAYVQSVPSSSVYVIPDHQIYYSTWYPAYYPYYSYYGGCYPYYSYSWCGGYHGGCYYRGAYCGGSHYNGYHGGNYCYAGGYHGGVTYASRGASYHGGGFASVGGSFRGGGGFGGGFHGGGMMRR